MPRSRTTTQQPGMDGECDSGALLKQAATAHGNGARLNLSKPYRHVSATGAVRFEQDGRYFLENGEPFIGKAAELYSCLDPARAAIATKRKQQFEAAAYLSRDDGNARKSAPSDRETQRLDDFEEASRELAEALTPDRITLLRNEPDSSRGREAVQAIQEALREHDHCWELLARRGELTNHPWVQEGAARRRVLDGPGSFRRIKNADPGDLATGTKSRSDWANNWIATIAAPLLEKGVKVTAVQRMLRLEARSSPNGPEGYLPELAPMRDELLSALGGTKQAFHKRLSALGLIDAKHREPPNAELAAVLGPKPPKHFRDVSDVELERLSPRERAELLALLEAREAARASEPDAVRTRVWHFIAEDIVDEADKSADPDAYLTAALAHERAVDFHYECLEAERPPIDRDVSFDGWVETWSARYLELQPLAEAAATADGFPPPEQIVGLREAPMPKVVEADEWDLVPSALAAPPPRPVAAPEPPPAAQPAPRPKVSAPFVPPQPVRDVLGPFRDRSDGLTPAAYEDQ